MTLKILKLVLPLVLSSCFYVGKDQYSDLASKRTNDWDSRESLTIIAGASSYNLLNDYGYVKVMATPYFPSVIRAIGKREQMRRKWTNEQRDRYIADLVLENIGERFSWDEPDRIDTLTVLIMLTNTTYPCVNPIIIREDLKQMVPLFGPGQMPCPEPDITNLQNNIYLENEKAQKVHARTHWGIRHARLTTDETFFLKFQVGSGAYNFLKHSSSLSLHIVGFEHDIVMPLQSAK